VIPRATRPTPRSASEAGSGTAKKLPLPPPPWISLGAVGPGRLLEITGFDLNGTPVSSAFTTGTGGYGIYEQFTATSHLDPCTTGLCGAFDSITATVYLYSTVHGLASYTFPGPSHNVVIHLPSEADPTVIVTETGPLASTVSAESDVHNWWCALGKRRYFVD
jgi:hypothetical protein